MGDSALNDDMCDVGVVPTTQCLRKKCALDRTSVIIVRSNTLINFQFPIALLANALWVKGFFLAARMWTSQTRRTRLHVPAIACALLFIAYVLKNKSKKLNISPSAY